MNGDIKDLFNESIAEKWKKFYFVSTIDIIGDVKVQPSRKYRDYILGTDGGGYYIVGETGSVEWYDTLEGVQKFFKTKAVNGAKIIVVWEGDGEPPHIDGVTVDEG